MPLFMFVQGERAFERGAARTECPYPEEDRSGAEWLAGWDAAEDAANHYADQPIRPAWESDQQGTYDLSPYGGKLTPGT